jgi:hypothetical protein
MPPTARSTYDPIFQDLGSKIAFRAKCARDRAQIVQDRQVSVEYDFI